MLQHCFLNHNAGPCHTIAYKTMFHTRWTSFTFGDFFFVSCRDEIRIVIPKVKRPS